MFTHLDDDQLPTMVDIGGKNITDRIAVAESLIYLPHVIMEHFSDGDIKSKKGPVFQTAIIAATMAVKKTSELIPFCHPLNLDAIKINIKKHDDSHLIINCYVKNTGKTGVEMEALTGASVAALTIYDMCKAFSQEMKIVQTRLVEKKGGKSDYRA